MATKHTRDALEAYHRIESALASLTRMLMQENIACARRPDVTTLECVAVRTEELVRNWHDARKIADADRQIADAREQLLDQEAIRYGG